MLAIRVVGVIPSRPRRWFGLAAFAVVGPLALSGCQNPFSGSDSAEPAPSATAPSAGTPSENDPAADAKFASFYQQKPNWSDCADGFSCAEVKVPVNWDEPTGETITLKMTRLPASNSEARIGALFLNPGGPGVPGVPFAQAISEQFDKKITSVYDLVSWDTRGTGESSPVQCLPNKSLDAYYASDGTPDNAAEVDSAIASTKEYVASCQANTGALLKHMDTLSTVRDMDVMRAIVGEKTLTYLGGSYGTFLGAWYAQEFPWRVGRLVLDGAVDPSLDAAASSQSQAMGFARAVEAYVDSCLAKRGCPLRGTRAEAYRQIERLLAQADAQPLPTDDPKRPLTEALMTTGMIMGMYSQSFWSTVTQGITDAMAGKGTTLLLLADAYLERDDSGKYGQTLQAYTPIYCLDHADTRTVEQIAAQAKELAAKYPPFGASMGWGGLSCVEWPYPAVVPTEKLTAQGAPPILVVGTTGDPATPYESAVALAKMLSSGHLLTRVGEGHTGYQQGSVCTDNAVNAYLLNGTLPAEGLRCKT